MALSVPTHLAYATSQTGPGVSTLAFASTSPASDCLLIVAGGQDSANNTQDAISSITTTLSGVGAWTTIHKYNGTSGTGSWISYAVVTGAPGSGTVTVNWAAAQDGVSMELLYVTGHDTTTPVPHHDEFQGASGTTGSGTLAVTPASTSLIFVAFEVLLPTNVGSANVLPGSGFTELGEQYIGNTTWNFGLDLETQYRLTGTGTAIATSGSNDPWAMQSIEIAQASAVAYVPNNVTVSRAAVNRAGSW